MCANQVPLAEPVDGLRIVERALPEVLDGRSGFVDGLGQVRMEADPLSSYAPAARFRASDPASR